MEKIVQTAGRNALGKFAPEFAHYNDDIYLEKTGIRRLVSGRRARSRQPCS